MVGEIEDAGDLIGRELSDWLCVGEDHQIFGFYYGACRQCLRLSIRGHIRKSEAEALNLHGALNYESRRSSEVFDLNADQGEAQKLPVMRLALTNEPYATEENLRELDAYCSNSRHLRGISAYLGRVSCIYRSLELPAHDTGLFVIDVG